MALKNIKNKNTTNTKIEHQNKLKKKKKKIYITAWKKIPFLTLSYLDKKASFDRKISIMIRSNNIFCNLRNITKNRTILARSSGKYRILISKKRLKHSATRVIKAFSREAKKKLTRGGVFISLIAPIKLRKKIIDILKVLRPFKLIGDNKRYYRAMIIKVNDKKCFNGCRPAKRKRKKRTIMRFKKY